MGEIAQLIKCEDEINGKFILKHHKTDFNSLTQLIVHEGQEAIFYMNGQALDAFGPGRYTLETQNIPKIGKALNKQIDENPFHCEVYFINKTERMSIKWGTDSKVQYIEPTYGFPLSIGASGEMNLRVENGRELLIKVLGTNSDEFSQDSLVQMFRSFLMTRVKTYIAQVMKSESINIFEIDEKLTEFSDKLKELLVPDFKDYGVSLERFFVTNIAKPDGDRQYEQFKDLHFRQYADIAEAKLKQQKEVIDAETQAKKVVIDSQAQATKRAQEGYTYQQERGFDVAEKVADNEAVGQFTNMGVGLGTMAGVGGAIGGIVGGSVNNAINTANQQPANEAHCPNCGQPVLPNAKFCPNCGQKIVVNNNVVCPGCGKTVSSGKFCPECGAKLG